MSARAEYEVLPEIGVLSPVKPPVVKIAKNLPQGQNRAKKAVLTALSASEKVDKLVSCENPKRITNLIILDTNGKHSAGILMFQYDTMAYYVKRYGFRTKLTKTDWLNPSLQRETAIAMLKESSANIGHWKNCAISNGLLAKKMKKIKILYLIDFKISWRTFKTLQDKLVWAKDSGPKPKEGDKILWQMIRDRKVFAWFCDEMKNDMAVGLTLPKNRRIYLITNPKK